MQLHEALRMHDLVPPAGFPVGKVVRLRRADKPNGKRPGWLILHREGLATFGDWSRDFASQWRDDALRPLSSLERVQLRDRERRARREQAKRAQAAADFAAEMLGEAQVDQHPYLARKGFKHQLGFVREGELLIPMRAAEDYERLLGVQRIASDGTKRFLSGARTKGAVHILGRANAARNALCEGYATGLSVHAALRLLPGEWSVVVCFSAQNMLAVARHFRGAIICADNDESGVGKRTAINSMLPWVMPGQYGDFNDLHTSRHLTHVVEILRPFV